MATPKRPARKTRDYAAVERRIMPAENATPISSALWYGRPGGGKTWLAATAGEIAPTLLIDTEKGSSSIRKKTGVDVYKLTEFSEIDEVYWYLVNKGQKYKFVVIDTLSTLQAHCLRQVLKERSEKDLSVDPRMPERQSWGKCGELMRGVITAYRDIPGTFTIFTCHERRREAEEEDDTVEFNIGPQIQPAVKGYLMGAIDIIGRVYVKTIEDEEETDEDNIKVERRLLTGAHEVYDSKDRSDNLPRVMRDPTMRKIIITARRK